MIRYARENDNPSIKALRRDLLKDQSEFIEYYNKYLYHYRNTLVYEEDGQIVSAIDLRNHQISLGGRRIAANRIVALTSTQEAKDKGLQDELVAKALDMSSRQFLVTLVGNDSSGYFENYGFRPRYLRQIYEFKKSDFPKYGTHGVSTYLNMGDLNGLYLRFTSHFQGSYILEENRFEHLIQRLEIENGHLYTYYQGNNLEGYYVAYEDSDSIYLSEVMYDNGEALSRLLAHAANRRPNIIVECSKYERLDKLIPVQKSQTKCDLLLRVNDDTLFRKCFQLGKDESLKTIWNYKPMYNCEKD